MLTYSEAKAWFEYDADSGRLMWARPHQGVRIGDTAGGFQNGTLYVTLSGVRHKVADIAWVLYHGRKPPRRIRHVNGNRSDIRIRNLSTSQPCKNPGIDLAGQAVVGIHRSPHGFHVVSFLTGEVEPIASFPDYARASECAEALLSRIWNSA